MQTAMGHEECFCEFVLKDKDTLEELEAHTRPQADWFDFRGFGQRLDEWAGFSLMASGASILQHPTFLRGLERLALRPTLRAQHMHTLASDAAKGFHKIEHEAIPGTFGQGHVQFQIRVQPRPDRADRAPHLIDRGFHSTQLIVSGAFGRQDCDLGLEFAAQLGNLA